MIHKKKLLIFAILIIFSIQFFLYLNNNQKSTFRFLTWDSNEFRLGGLINISFFSGFLISTILNKVMISKETIYNRKSKENIFDDTEKIENEENYKSDTEIPPQRDIREKQPTISVNYRIIKNKSKSYSEDYENNIDNQKSIDDWDNNNSDW